VLRAGKKPRNQSATTLIVDSGAEIHAVGNESILYNVRRLDEAMDIIGVGKSKATHCGDLDVNILLGGRPVQFTITAVVVPGLKCGILSPQLLAADEGLGFTVTADAAELFDILTGESSALQFKYGSPSIPAGPPIGGKSEPPGPTMARHLALLSRTKSLLSKLPLHERFGHLSDASLLKLLLAAAPFKGRKHVLQSNDFGDCVACPACARSKITSKRKRKRQRKPRSRVDGAVVPRMHSRADNDVELANQRVALDFIGPLPTGDGKCRYALHFEDLATGFGWVYNVASRSQAGEALQMFLQDNQQHPQALLLPVTLRSDNAGEFVGPNSDFAALCRELRISLRPVPSHSSELNGRIERANRTLLEMTRAMLLHSGLSIRNWPYATKHARTLLNLLPKSDSVTVDQSGQRPMSPFEAWTAERPGIEHFRTFGCRVYFRDPSPQHKHVSARAREAVFLGIGASPSTYLLRALDSDRLCYSRDVVFDERVFPAFRSADTQPDTLNEYLAAIAKLSVETVPLDADDEVVNSDDSDSDSDSVISLASDASSDSVASVLSNSSTASSRSSIGTYDVANPDDRGVGTRRSTRPRAATGAASFRFDPSVNSARPQLGSGKNYTAYPFQVSKGRLVNCAGATRSKREKRHVRRAAMDLPPPPTNHDPSFSAAMADPVHGRFWEEAMNSEWENLFSSGAFKWVPKCDVDRSVKPLPCHVLAKYKALSKRYKMRVVINGKLQQVGSYGDTYAPTVASAIVRLVLSIGVHMGWDIVVVDVKGAFLYSALPADQVIYVYPPKGYERDGYIIQLEKASYGLKQAPFLWAKTLHKAMAEFGLEASMHDASLFHSEDNTLVVAAHVDDLTISGPDEQIKRFIAFLKTKFTLTTESTVTDLLGMEINYDRNSGSLTMSQEQKVDALLKDMDKFVAGLPRKVTPTSADVRLVKPDADHATDFRSRMQQKHGRKWEENFMPYRSLVGSIQYLMTCTRPDLTFAVSHLSRFMSNFLDEHWTEALRVLQYLKRVKDRPMVISRDKLKDFTLSAWVDSDWAGDPSERRSVSGFIIYLGEVPILWKSQMQSKTALSSGEAEFVAMSEATRHILMLRFVLAELGFEQSAPTPVHGDSTAALQALKSQKCDSKLKHVETRYHRTRQEVSLGNISLEKVPSKGNIADAFTKALRAEEFNCLMTKVFDGPSYQVASDKSGD
jgi:hypothetical protein